MSWTVQRKTFRIILTDVNLLIELTIFFRFYIKTVFRLFSSALNYLIWDNGGCEIIQSCSLSHPREHVPLVVSLCTIFVSHILVNIRISIDFWDNSIRLEMKYELNLLRILNHKNYYQHQENLEIKKCEIYYGVSFLIADLKFFVQ